MVDELKITEPYQLCKLKEIHSYQLDLTKKLKYQQVFLTFQSTKSVKII